jgi:hypothetical protein
VCALAADPVGVAQAIDLLPSPVISVVCACVDAHVGQALQLAHQHRIGAQLLARTRAASRGTTPARSIAASTPELPPPITATRLPLNSGPSQCGQ